MALSSLHTGLTSLSAVVVGGSRGLGLLLADELLRRGCAVTIAARDEKELMRAEAALRRRRGDRVRAVACDARDREAVHDLFQGAAAERGSVDIAVANAGIIQVGPVAALGPSSFEDAMGGIFQGAVHTALEAMPYLRDSAAGGRLALIGSVGGLLAVPHLLPYSCAKSAVGTLAEGLYAEAARDGVSVTVAHPGLMRTGSHLHAEFGGDQRKEFGWFSALAGTPLVSMDAQRAAGRIVTAVQRRRVRLVLTPAARAADLAHGLAPALTTRLSAVAARALPTAHGDPDLRPGADIDPPSHPVVAKLRAWGSALNDRAADAYNERRPAHE